MSCMADQDYESRVPAEAVSILRNESVEKESENRKLEIWMVKDKYQVTVTKEVRAYNCTCRFGSVHGDKDGICKHVAAVELRKMSQYLNESILEEIKNDE